MIKKLIMLGVLAILVFVFAESIGPGVTPLKCAGDSLYNKGVYITTDAATDTSYSKWYLMDDVGFYNSIRIVVDSVRGACSLAVILQESFDGSAVEFQTTLMRQNVDSARLDTVLEVDLYPSPYMRLLLYETDAAEIESLQIDTLVFFSHE